VIKIQLIFYSDIGHAWLRVPLKLLRELGIMHKITKYSYVSGNNAYLEEDVDAHTFCEAYEKVHGSRPTYEEIDQGRSSPIRNYMSFITFRTLTK